MVSDYTYEPKYYHFGNLTEYETNKIHKAFREYAEKVKNKPKPIRAVLKPKFAQ